MGRGSGGRVPGLHDAAAGGRAERRLVCRDQAQTGVGARGRPRHGAQHVRHVPVLPPPVPEAVPGRRPVAEHVLSAGHVLGVPRTGPAGRQGAAPGPAEQFENLR